MDYKVKQYLSIYCTFGQLDEAEKVGMALVEAGLVACVNIVPGIRSIYAWEGAIQRDDEVLMVAKTTTDRYAELEARIRALHSYSCPCILAYGLDRGYPPYLKWIDERVGKASSTE